MKFRCSHCGLPIADPGYSATGSAQPMCAFKGNHKNTLEAKMYTMHYRLRGKRKWLPVTGASQPNAFSIEDAARYTELLCKRHMVAWHEIELKQVQK